MAGRNILPNCNDITAFENETCCTTATEVVDIDDAVDEEIGVGTGRIPSSEYTTISLILYMSAFFLLVLHSRGVGNLMKREKPQEKRKSCPAPASVAKHKTKQQKRTWNQRPTI